MLVTPHALMGAAIGLRLKHPLRIIPVAVASHFLLDTVPHWQETLSPYRPTVATWIRIPIDLSLATLGVAWIARRGSWCFARTCASTKARRRTRKIWRAPWQPCAMCS